MLLSQAEPLEYLGAQAIHTLNLSVPETFRSGATGREAAMATITTADAPRSPRVWPRWWRRGQARDAAATAARQAVRAATAVRDRDWSPALTISGLGAIDIAAWETYGRGAAWLALGISTLLYDWQRDR